MLRTAIICSLITRTPFRMTNIRGKRDKPGLKAQHVRVLEALRSMGPVSFSGAEEGSSEVAFTPAPLRGADFAVDIGTAGSVSLLLQTLLPAALMAKGPSRITINGGTDVAWSPPIDYLRVILLPVVARFARRLELDVKRRGFYPRGGGRVVLEAEGWVPRAPIALTQRGPLRRIRLMSVASASLRDRRVAERQGAAAAARLKKYEVELIEEEAYAETLSPGTVITCLADFEGGACLAGSARGEIRKRAEDVGREAADALSAEMSTGAVVDEHAADQIIPWLALAGGTVRTGRLTDHARTNIWVTEQFLGSLFEVEGSEIRCQAPYAGGWTP